MGQNRSGQLGDGTFNSTGTNRHGMIIVSGVSAISTGHSHDLFIKNDGSLWAVGNNQFGQLGDGTFNTNVPFYGNNRPEQILGAYNKITGLPLSGGNLQFSFQGIAEANYALDRSFSLAPPNWIPQATNPANSFGALVFTNTPDPATNNFWRIRSVP